MARNDRYGDVRKDIEEIAERYSEVLEVHGFYVVEDMNMVTFDMIVDFDSDREKIKDEITRELSGLHPEFDSFYIIDDYDVSD